MMKTIGNWFQSVGQKKNNKGAALVVVIVSVALIGIMVSVILSMAFVNYKMKLTNLQAKNNFYTAETALEEIKTGLQEDVSVALSQAYVLAMENYTSIDDDNHREVFQTEYVKCLRERLAEAGSNSEKYDLDYLTAYLDQTKYDNTNNVGARLDKTQQNNIKVTTKGVTICNLVVNFVNAKQYESEIKTDIVLNFPEMDFYKMAETPSLIQYSMIANRQFQAKGVVSAIRGSAYMGEEGALLNNAALSFENMNASSVKELLITNGVLQVENGSKLTVENKELWAGTILADASEVDINADTYVNNDLIVNNSIGQDNSKPKVSVRLKGNYYGYGNIKTAIKAEALSESSASVAANPATYSSAMVVNGAKATVDLSGLGELMLAGNSYIGASQADALYESTMEKPTNSKNKDIAMGESISIKSNQMAYLVPAECIAPDATSGRKNPMTAAQYQTLQEELKERGMALVDLTGKKTIDYGTTLSDMGVTGYQTVCYPVNNVGSMVYIFMEFNNEKAANNFFTKYYSISKNLTKLREYLNLYTDALRIPDSMDTDSVNSTFYYNGNIVVNDENADSFYINKLQGVTEQENKKLTAEQVALQNRFYTLNKNLTKDYFVLTPEQKKEDIWVNLVKTFTYSDANKNITGSKIFVTLGDNPLGAILVNGDYTVSSDRITGVNQLGERAEATLCVVIAAGDVKVKRDFSGLIIAKGDIILDKDYVNLSANPVDVSIALRAEDSQGIKPLDYLVNAEDYIIGGMTLADDTKQTESIKMGDLITYENWTKQ